jgi:hypothetical protein
VGTGTEKKNNKKRENILNQAKKSPSLTSFFGGRFYFYFFYFLFYPFTSHRSTRRPFGGASYAPRGNTTTIFRAPTNDTGPAAGISRGQQEIATGNLAMGGSGVLTRRDGDPASRAPAHGSFMYGGGGGGGGGGGFDSRAGTARSAVGSQQPQRVRVQSQQSGSPASSPGGRQQGAGGWANSTGRSDGAMNATGRGGYAAHGAAASPRSPHQGAAAGRNIAIADPGTVDLRSNYSSSDNPLATGYANTRPSQGRSTEARYVKFAAPEGSPVAAGTSNVASDANPLAPVHRVGPKPVAIKTYTGRQPSHTSQPQAPARVADQDAKFRGYVKFAAPEGSVSASSNVASDANPLAPIHKVYERPEPKKINVTLIPRG